MSKELPGFYFDPQKNRYFPSASEPARSKPLARVPATDKYTPNRLSSPPPQTPHRSSDVWHAIQRSRFAKYHGERMAATQFVSLATTCPDSYWLDASAK